MPEQQIPAALVERFAASAAIQMEEQAQGYTTLGDYGREIELSWYSDTPGHFQCELSIDGVSRQVEVTTGAEGLAAALETTLSD
jgi:predicted aspartyl protease